ncbi:MAG: enoyl-CoA hydratase/isomerase family protein [Cyanobacteria bacterium]|nr:enoyl-CoA hydratase/isomerase family protein [Cyanobacteriota bacterium]
MSASPQYQYILTRVIEAPQKQGGADNADALRHVGIVQLNRPEVLNALSPDLMAELVEALEAFDKDPSIGCLIVTGNEKAFAAGADIKRMADASAVEMLMIDQLARWDRIRKLHKPVIAAVSGYVLGGGCELMMMCDMVIAAENTRLGQPEISIGVIPGAGGTQRLTRAIGKARAMELILTGRQFSASEAFEAGLITRVVANELYLDEAIHLAQEIAEKPPIAVRLAKEAILKSFDTTIEAGLDYERKLFYLLFASADQKEGMSAFIEKRPAVFLGR